ncbi:187-kDa microtubule-associated protein AIR9-like [Typha angustifolia]|uniref:187-kDa microtubule-associated protein AIR9-like n=1 Tax=Typha angustifolia TaxID=59011 RepID=UPI003C2B0111
MESLLDSNSLAARKRSHVSSVERVKNSLKFAKPHMLAAIGRRSVSASSIKKKDDDAPEIELNVSGLRPILINSSLTTNAASLRRRNSIGGTVYSMPKPQENGDFGIEKVPSSVPDPGKKIESDSQPRSGPSDTSKLLAEGRRASPVSHLSSTSDSGNEDFTKKPSVNPSLSISSLKKVSSPFADSSYGHSSLKTISSSSSLVHSPSVTISLKLESMSSSVNGGTLSSRRNCSALDSHDSSLEMLPQVDVKPGDEKRLDLRGQRVRKLNALNLSPDLEFVYLRDNLLSSLEGIEILKRVKVLDLSFNTFKGSGFDTLGNCKELLQLNLAGNRITSLASLPQLPNLEFLSVAQNRLRSLSMVSQPRLKVLAASKNKISTLKGFPHLPSLEHLRVEENPILEMPHLEAATILLVGSTLKQFNDRDLSPSEKEVAKLYPAHTTLCIQDGWEFCRPELAADSTFSFLAEQWKKHLPPGYMIEEASVDQPFEEDACGCHFKFTSLNSDCELVLKHQWFIGDRTPTNFVTITDAVGEVYWPKHEDIGKYLKVECTPIMEDTEFPSVFAISSPVSPAAPSVRNVRIVGHAVEGNIIEGFGEYFGGKEGQSKYQWLREKENSEFLLASSGTTEYAVTEEDVGRHVKFVYIPVNSEGQEGKSASVMTEIVKKAPLKVTNLKIVGDLREGNKVAVAATVIGGTEEFSWVQWFKTSASKLEGEHSLEALTTSKIAKAFCIPLCAVGYYIVAKFCPGAPNGETGEPVYVISEQVVETLPPCLIFLTVTGEFSEGEMLTASYGYIGGHEGKSLYSWYLHETDADKGEPIPEASGLVQYCIPKKAIGKFISFKCTPMRDDGVVGDPRTFLGKERVRPGGPRLLSLKISGKGIEGFTLVANKKYWGGEEGDSIFRWFLTSSDGTQSEITGIRTGSYTLTCDDIGFLVSTSCEPIRSDGARGPVVFSENIGPILPADPRGSELVLPGCFEDEEIIPLKTYYGGKEGVGKYTWYRTKSKIAESELVHIASLSCDVNIVGETLTYIPSLNDVGSYLALCWVPTRADGKAGDPLISISSHPVMAALPSVSGVCLKEIGSGVYNGSGVYYGGYEGSSLHSWYRETNEETIIPITGANSTTYEVTDSDYECRLLYGYTPVRSDGVVGKLKLSEPSTVILPELPKIEMLFFEGKEVEGEILTAVEIIPKNEVQQLIWDKYKKEIVYEWSHSIGTGECQSFETLAAQHSCSYKMCLEDIGRCLKCECVVIDKFGRSSEPVSAVTSPILPGTPKIYDLKIEGSGFHTNLYAVRGTYSGGREGKSKIQWLKSTVASPDLISIPGEVGRTYEANIDDVGYRLVAVYTPVREDGVEGLPVSASTEPIAVEPDVYKEVQQKLDLGSMKFEVLYDKARPPKMAPGVQNLEKRILEVNRKRVKVVKPGSNTLFQTIEVRGTYAPPFHVDLNRNDQLCFKIVINSDNEVKVVVPNQYMRDVIVLVLRGLAQKFNSTSLNSLLKLGR